MQLHEKGPLGLIHGWLNPSVLRTRSQFLSKDMFCGWDLGSGSITAGTPKGATPHPTSQSCPL